MTYNETIDWLFHALPAYHRVGAAAYKANLDNTEALMQHLDHPENAFRSIHVAGTNGKGSVSHCLAAMLKREGLKVGLYTSPHLIDFRERIQIDGEMISKDAVVDFVEKKRSFFESRQLSFFEMTVGLAFDYFRRNNVDIAVIEVGMGGRLDSTNVIRPILSIITNIGLEHTQFLGDTLEKIASEKAGIIKPGVPVVIGETHPETEPVFRRIASQNNSPIFFADKHYKVVEVPPKQLPSFRRGWGRSMFVDVYRDGELFISKLESPLSGIYQLKNLATLIAACDLLNDVGEGFSQRGMKGEATTISFSDYEIPPVNLRGRWEIIDEKPLTVAETAHNPDGIRLLLDKLKTMHYDKLHLIYGCVNDKDYISILEMLPYDASYYFTKPSVERGLNADTLALTAKQHNRIGNAYKNVHLALQQAHNNASPNDLIIITGSIFLIADLFNT